MIRGLKLYIPTLEETARAILDNNDYSLYKYRKRLLEYYSLNNLKIRG